MALIDDFLPALAFAAMLGSEGNLAQTPYDVARADMDRLLLQAMDAARRENPAQADQALFAVCAFADEVVLASPWPGRSEWMRNKLQQVHFNTVNAGEEFYQRLATLCGTPPREQLDMSVFDNLEQKQDPDRREVLEVYVTCLTLGFTGKFYGNAGRETLDALTRSNLQLLQGADPTRVERIFPEAYAKSTRLGKRPWLSPGLRLVFQFTLPVILAITIYATYASLLSTFVANWLQALG